jgi:DNA-binding XRE family transcriptional regulator
MLQDIVSPRADDARMKKRSEDPERDAYNRELGARLVIARKAVDLNAAKAAKDLGIPRNTYLKYERGERQFPMHRILDFCVLTGAPPAFVVTGRMPEDWRIGPETGKFKRPRFPTPTPSK